MIYDVTDRNIKEVYNHLMGDCEFNKLGKRQKHIRNDWYPNYIFFKEETQRYKGFLEEGRRLDKNADYEFLRMLFREEGVSKGGQGKIGEDKFKKLIDDDNVLTTLGYLILKADGDSIEDVEDAIENFYKVMMKRIREDYPKTKNKFLVTNRIIACATEKVSSTVSTEAFNNVFNFLIREKLIEPYEESEYCVSESNEIIIWYRKNLHVMKELKKKFGAELKANETDMTRLSIFFWEFNEYQIKGMKYTENKNPKYTVPINTDGSKKVAKKSSLKRRGGYWPSKNSETITRRQTFTGKGFTYVLRFGETNIWKIGRSRDVERRVKEINAHVPSEEYPCPEWIRMDEFEKEWENEKKAMIMEQEVLKTLDAKEKWTSGERVKCTKKLLKQVWEDAIEKCSK